MSGVPFPARNKNGVDKTTRQDARSDTLLLNHLLSNSIKSSPKIRPTIILGSLIAKLESPNHMIEYFCNTL
jgi:hypothetical protein